MKFKSSPKTCMHKNWQFIYIDVQSVERPVTSSWKGHLKNNSIFVFLLCLFRGILYLTLYRPRAFVRPSAGWKLCLYRSQLKVLLARKGIHPAVIINIQECTGFKPGTLTSFLRKGSRDRVLNIILMLRSQLFENPIIIETVFVGDLLYIRWLCTRVDNISEPW